MASFYYKLYNSYAAFSYSSFFYFSARILEGSSLIYPPPLINSAKAATASSSESPAGLGGGFFIYFSISSAIAIGFYPADIIYEKASMSSVAAVPISSEPTTFTYLNSYSIAFTIFSF